MAVVELPPDFAEAWNRRAYVYFVKRHQARVGRHPPGLALDPHHYKALDGLGRILSNIGQKKGALAAYEQLARHLSGPCPAPKKRRDELRVEVEGQGI